MDWNAWLDIEDYMFTDAYDSGTETLTQSVGSMLKCEANDQLFKLWGDKFAFAAHFRASKVILDFREYFAFHERVEPTFRGIDLAISLGSFVRSLPEIEIWAPEEQLAKEIEKIIRDRNALYA